MGGLFGGAKPQAQQSPAIAGIRPQTSAYGKAIPIVYGTTRIAPNLGWYGGFHQVTTNNPSSGGGGKGGATGGGGGKGGGGGSTTTNFADVVFLLCEGPIAGISDPGLWKSQTETTLSAEGMAVFDGAYGQAEWSFLASNFPSQAVPYSGIAYTAVSGLNLGTSANLPSYNMEVQGFFAGTGNPSAGDADPSRVIPHLLSDPFVGAGFPASRIGTLVNGIEGRSIPAGGPFTIQLIAVNPDGWTILNNLCVYDNASPPNLYTCVAGAPGPQQYSVNLATGTYTFNAANAGTALSICYAALNPPLVNYQGFAMASGLWISPAYTDQQSASTILDDIAKYTYADFVWSSGVLTLVPRGTVALSGNGFSYAPVAAPVVDLSDDDFLPNTNSSGGASSSSHSDPVLLTRKRPADQTNSIKIEALDRINQYAPTLIEASDQAAIDRFGKRASASATVHMFADVNAANTSAHLLLADQHILNFYGFTLDERYAFLDSADIVTITDVAMGLSKQWVRITEITENDDGTLSVSAEEYSAGSGSAPLITINQGQGFIPNYLVSPGSVNPPIIFEPTDAFGGGLEVLLAVSGSNPNWGGAHVWLSFDGITYEQLPDAIGLARMGSLTAPLASVTAATTGQTLDTTNTLAVDLTESNGVLSSASQGAATTLNSLCYVDGELISYQTATLTGPSKYNLTYLMRGAYNTPIPAHAAGSQFARMDGAIYSIPFTQDRIGQTIHIKLTSFNIYDSGEQSLSSVADYTHTIKGTALASPLPNVQNLTSFFQGAITFLTWDEVTDFRPVLYEIRKGTSFGGAQVVARQAHPPFQTQGDGTYWVTAYSQPIAGLQVYSAAPQSAVISGSVIVTNVIASFDEAATGWTGTTGGTAVVVNGQVMTSGAGNILADPDFLNTSDIFNYGGEGSGTYEIPAAHEIDIGRVAACLVRISWLSQGQVIGFNVLAIPDFLGASDILDFAASANTSVYPEIALSQDGVSWGAWQKFYCGTYSARKFKARMQIQTSDVQTQAILESFVFSVDVPDRDDHYIGLAVPSGGLALSFKPDGSASPAPFNGGPGSATIPSLQGTIVSASQGDTLVVSAETLSGCTLQVINGGVGVARSVNLLAQGF